MRIGALDGVCDLDFVPVGRNCDRVLEDRRLTSALATPKGVRPRFKFNPLIILTGFQANSGCG